MHLPRSLIAAVARGEEPQELQDEILREHLAALCPVCAEVLQEGEALRSRPEALLPVEPPDPVERLRRRLGMREVELLKHLETAREWVKDVVKLDPEVRRRKVLRAYVRFKGPLFCTLLLEEARKRIPGDPAEALSLADAVLASNRKTGGDYWRDAEIEAPALAVRGNAARALGRLLEAEADLEEARRLLGSPGVTDPATPAEVLSYLGSLRKDQGRLHEAVHHLHRAASLYRLERDREKAARVHLTLSLVQYAGQDFPAAIEAARKALKLLGSHVETGGWLRAYAHYNLAFHLHAAGETDRAEGELEAHEELLSTAGDEVVQHVVWLRARIAWSRDDLPAAEGLFTEARELALERGIAWDAGLVALELALVHLARGRTDRATALAAEALPVFAEQEVERETRAALELLEAAARREALTREVFEQVISALERAPHSGRPTGETS